jgi:hypothetical protein
MLTSFYPDQSAWIARRWQICLGMGIHNPPGQHVAKIKVFPHGLANNFVLQQSPNRFMAGVGQLLKQCTSDTVCQADVMLPGGLPPAHYVIPIDPVVSSCNRDVVAHMLEAFVRDT